MSSQAYAATGAEAYLNYGWESTFDTPITAGTGNKYFGRNVRATTMSVQSNFEYLYELAQRQASVGRYKQFEGSLSIDSILSSPWIMKAAFGKVTDAGSPGAYTHTFTRQTAAPSLAALPSFTTEAGMALPSGNQVRTFSGCVVKSMRMSGAVNDWIKTTTDIFFATEQTIGTSMSANVGPDSFQPFIFADGTLSLWTGAGFTPIGEIQNFDVSLNNNILPVYGIGDAHAVEVLAQAFNVELKFTCVFKSAFYLNYFLNQINLTGSGGTLYKAAFTATDGTVFELDGLTGGYVQDHGIRGYEPNALILEDVTLTTIDAQAVATNTIQTTP